MICYYVYNCHLYVRKPTQFIWSIELSADSTIIILAWILINRWEKKSLLIDIININYTMQEGIVL